jgi:cation transport ATPase
MGVRALASFASTSACARRRGGVQALRPTACSVTLLSGDRPERAHGRWQRLGITEVLAGATPEAKLAAVTRAQAGAAW